MITRILIIGACKVSYHNIDPISIVHVYFEKHSHILFIFALTWIANTKTYSQKMFSRGIKISEWILNLFESFQWYHKVRWNYYNFIYSSWFISFDFDENWTSFSSNVKRHSIDFFIWRNLILTYNKWKIRARLRVLLKTFYFDICWSRSSWNFEMRRLKSPKNSI